MHAKMANQSLLNTFPGIPPLLPSSFHFSIRSIRQPRHCSSFDTLVYLSLPRPLFALSRTLRTGSWNYSTLIRIQNVNEAPRPVMATLGESKERIEHSRAPEWKSFGDQNEEHPQV